MENSSQAAKKPPNGEISVKTRGGSHKKKVITRAEIVAWKREKRVEKKVETNEMNNIVTDGQLEASREKRNMPISDAIKNDPQISAGGGNSHYKYVCAKLPAENESQTARQRCGFEAQHSKDNSSQLVHQKGRRSHRTEFNPL
jgi:hypothetical protein